MHNRDTADVQHSSSTRPPAIDENKLRRDVLAAISAVFADGAEFAGDDSRLYVIMAAKNAESESESFIDVLVKVDEGQQLVAKYAIVLQQISRRTVASLSDDSLPR